MRFPFGKNQEKQNQKIARVSLYMPEKLLKQIDEEAEKKGWSRNQYCVKVLEVFKAP